MRNITDEQIEKAFENEEGTRRRNSAYATAVEKIYHSKQFNIIFGIYLVFCIVFLFRSGGIIRLLKRSVIILLIPIALMAVSFGIFYIVTIIRSVKESKLSTGWFILSVPTAFKLKKYKSDPQKTEEYLLKKIHKYDGKAVCSLYLEALFNHYILEAELQKAAGLMEYADRIRGKSKISDRITAGMDFDMSIENKHCFETVRIFEENEDPFSEDALSGVMKLTNFLNTLGEYKFALGRYDEALDVFMKRKDCMLRHNETAPKPLQYDDDSFSAVSTDIAKCLIKLRLYDEAKGYLTEAKSLSSRKDIAKICGRLAEEMEIY